MSAPLGLLQFTEGVDGATLIANAQKLERLGYDTLWIPEVFGREPVATCAYLLAKTAKLRVGSGILNIYARDAHAAAQTGQTLAEISGGRFSLGLGVSHPVLVEPRGHTFEPPAKKMRSYLKALKAAHCDGPQPAQRPPVIIAAHGPKLVELAAQEADGLFMYLQPPEQIAYARKVLGPDKEIHAVVRTVLCPDGAKARAIARSALGFYIQLPAYHRAWASAGFDAGDYANGGSDRLLDVIAPWGDAAKLRATLDTFVAAGASHVSLYPIHPDDDYSPDRAGGLLWDWKTLEALAPG
jgi:probable F420-dependent oxidoreductase